MSTTYSIYLNGVQKGKSKNDVSAKLALLFKQPIDQIEKILNSNRYKIKGGLDAHTASAYRIAIENAGAIVEVIEESADIVLPIDNISNTLSGITDVSQPTPNVLVQGMINSTSNEAVTLNSIPAVGLTTAYEPDRLFIKKSREDGERLYRVCGFIYNVMFYFNVLAGVLGLVFVHKLSEVSPWFAGVQLFLIVLGCGLFYIISVLVTHFGKVLVGILYSNLALVENVPLKSKT